MKSRLERVCLRIAELLVGHPRTVVGALLLSAGCCGWLAAHLDFDFSPQAIYRSNDDLVQYAEEFKRTFGYDEAVILVVLEATGERDVFDARALEWQAEIAPELKRIPGVQKVESLATLEIPRPTLTGIAVYPVVTSLPVDDAKASQIRSLLTGQPLVRGGMLSDDNRVAAIPVFLEPAGRKIAEMEAAVDAVKGAISQRPPPAEYRVRFTGLPVLRVEVVEDLRSDLLRLMPLSGLVYLLVLGLMFRRASGALLPLAAVGIGVLWTLATFTATGESLNVVSNVLPVLLVIIGVSSSVQIVSCYSEENARDPSDRKASVIRTIAGIAPACLLAAVTTAVGFVSLCTAHSVLLQRFGWQAAIGVGYQYVATLITLAALFPFFAAPKFADPHVERPGPFARFVGATGAAVGRHPWRAFLAALLVGAGAVWAGSGVQINSYAILETFSADHESVQTVRFVEEQLAGVMPMEISLTADRPGRFFEPEVFHKILAVEDGARNLPGVLAVQSYADLFLQVLSHWPGRRASETRVQLVPPGSAGEKRLQRTAGFAARFAGAFHYDSYVSADGQRARIRLRLREIGTKRTLALIDELEARLQKEFPADGPIEARLTGEGYINARALTTLIRDLYYSLLTASLVIFGLIAIEFRSLRAGMIAALPNLTPLAVTLGYMGLRGYDLNVGNVIVFTICLGLADDNSIHFLYRFREELHETNDVVAAIRQAFLSTGRAIVATSVILLMGMLVLLFSNFVPTRRFAELTSVTILANLLGVLLLLPACLVLFWKTAPASGERVHGR